MDKHLTKLSKFLSLILRHKPQVIGLKLDAHGWADVDELIDLVNSHGISVSQQLLDVIVSENDKARFTYNGDRTKIRAQQGHSLNVDVELTPQSPPQILFHGTATRFLASIREKGLLPGDRQHVHLTADEIVAIKVGQRHGQSAVLKIRAAEMWQTGHRFYHSQNGVWLAAKVPSEYIEFPTKMARSPRRL